MGAIRGIFYGAVALLTTNCLAQPALASDLWDAVAAANGRTLSENRSAKALYADHRRLNAALARLKPQRPGVVDAYVLVIGLDADPVFGREARETARVLSRRYDGIGRTVLLAAGDGAADASIPNGSPDNLAIALAAIAARMDVKEDALVLYATSHGNSDIGLTFRDGDQGFGVIGPPRLAAMLSDVGITNRLIMISACYSGVFVPSLQSEASVIITAASRERNSFGCNPSNDWTFFGDALINTHLRTPTKLESAVDKAFAMILGWENERGLVASDPQKFFGEKAPLWLDKLELRRPATASAKTGKPANAP